MKHFVIGLCSFLIIHASTETAYGYAAGPPEAHAGNPPNRTTCVACHSSFALNSGQGELRLLNLPEEGYVPNETYRLRVELADPNARRWGFQITPLTQNNQRAGNMRLVNNNITMLQQRNNAPQYINHTANGTFFNQNGSASWEFDWTAPDQDIGTVSFFFTGNASNGDGGQFNDRIYSRSAQIVAADEPEPEPDPDVFVMQLAEGWNLVSSPVLPEVIAFDSIFASLIEAEVPFIIRDMSNRLFIPNIMNEITEWSEQSAFQIKVGSAQNVEFVGTYVDSAASFLLSDGWNYLPYNQKFPNHPEVAFGELDERIVMIKSNEGGFLRADYEYNSIDMIMPGSAYQVLVTEDLEFSWGVGQNELDPPVLPPQTEQFVGLFNTGNSMNILLLDVNEWQKSDGDEVAVFAGDMLVGSAVLMDGITGITVWGDDAFTEDVDGATPNAGLTIVLWSSELDTVLNVELEIVEGEASLYYQRDQFYAVNITAPDLSVKETIEPALLKEFVVTAVYPNPFNATTEVSFSLNQASPLKGSLLTVDGRRALNLMDGEFAAGQHKLLINAAGLSAGIYFVEIQSPTLRALHRIVLLK